MSVQIAKSTPSAGRRTPLQISGGKSGKAQQNTNEDKETLNKEQNPPSTSGKAGKSDKNDNAEVRRVDKRHTSTDNQSTDSSNSAKDKGDEKRKEDKKKNSKEANKKDDNKQENGVNEGKDSNTSNGHKEVEKKIRETPRQKDLREQREKEEKEQEARKLKEAAEELKKNISKNEEVNVKDDPKDKEDSVSSKGDEKEVEIKRRTRKEPETPKKSERRSRNLESVTPTKDAAPKPTVSNEILRSLASDADEMEALLFDPENDVKEGPTETSTPGKILKIKQSPPKVSPKTHERQEVFERHVVTTKCDRPDSVSAPPLERPQFTASYRSISGRRSLRPTKEYNFHSSSLGTYRKINTELDYTASSLNATVGSEIANVSSFSFFGRGKKRERTPPPMASDNFDPELSPKSPKRARLDFSGILGIVASPVTMLRAKLSRTKIQCSTPNGKVTSTTSKDEEDGVENVSVIATDEMVTNEAAEAVEDVSIQDIEQEEDIDEDELIEDVDEDIEEPEDLKKPLNAQQIQQPVSTSMETVNKRRMCNIM